MKKYWVFDLDGTLVDSFSHFFLALKEIFSDHGARFSDDLRTRALTEPLPLFFEAHLGAAAVEPALLKLQELSNDDASRIQPFDGVTTILRQLREKGAKVAIWTNRDQTSASLILEETGLSTLIDLWVSGTCTT